eukprot:gene5854-6144_t
MTYDDAVAEADANNKARAQKKGSPRPYHFVTTSQGAFGFGVGGFEFGVGVGLQKESMTYDEAVAEADANNRARAKKKGSPRPYHFVTTSQGFRVEWSLRLHYYHFRKMKSRCIHTLGDDCEMGGFTRLLHGGEKDVLMDEMPTILLDPLPESVIEHKR